MERTELCFPGYNIWIIWGGRRQNIPCIKRIEFLSSVRKESNSCLSIKNWQEQGLLVMGPANERRDDVTMLRRLSLTQSVYRMVTEIITVWAIFVWRNGVKWKCLFRLANTIQLMADVHLLLCSSTTHNALHRLASVQNWYIIASNKHLKYNIKSIATLFSYLDTWQKCH